MKAVGVLFILVAIFMIANASNLMKVLQGKMRFTFMGTPVKPSTNTFTKAREGG